MSKFGTPATSLGPKVSEGNSSVSSTYKAASVASPSTKIGETLKTEGTSVTYGQMIVPVSQQVSSPSAAATKAVLQGSVKSGTSSTASVTPGPGMQAAKILGSAKVSKTPNSVPVSVGLVASAGGKGLLSPKDTLVKIIRNPVDVEGVSASSANVSKLGCKVKSDISIAAASSKKNATVVLPASKLEFQTPKTLVGSILNDFSKVAPNVVEYAAVLGSTVKTKEEVKKALTESAKIDLSLTMKSRHSEAIEFNSIKTPDLEVEFFYNFFSEDEENIETQEDQSRDPLLRNKPHNVPRYVDLQWNIANVTEPLAGTEKSVKANQKIRKETFYKPKGTFGHSTLNLPKSISKSTKKTRPFLKDGLPRKVTDIHEPDRAFSMISNAKSFGNSISTVLNISNSKSIVSELPYLQVKK